MSLQNVKRNGQITIPKDVRLAAGVVPGTEVSVRFEAGKKPLDAATVQAVIKANEERIAGKGRILIRKSGTEPLIRVMAECEDADMLRDVVDDIVGAVEKAL